MSRKLRMAASTAATVAVTIILGSDFAPARADNHRMLWSGDGYRILCTGSALTCGEDIDDPINQFARQDARRMGEIFIKVDAWFNDLKFPDRNLTKVGDDFLIRYQHGKCRPNAYACIIAPFGGLARKQIYLLPEADEIAIAHEMAHSLVPTKVKQMDWLDEAMAVAVGWAFYDKEIYKDTEIYKERLFPPHFMMDLDLPFHSGSEGGYEKAAYLRYVGEAIDSKDGVGHLVGLFTSLSAWDTVNGMRLLYGIPDHPIADAPFNKMFPGFVAKFNHIGEFKAEFPFYYKDVTDWEMLGFAHDRRATSRVSREVEAFAADAVLMSALSIDAPVDLPAEERLMIAEVEIASAERLEDLSLIFEHEVAGRAMRYLLVAGDSNDASQASGGEGVPHSGPFIRVANAGPTAADTAEQSYELAFTLEPTAIDLPDCMQAGTSVALEIDGADWSGVNNFEVSVSAGNMSGMVFEAPGTEQTVDVVLEVHYPLTRSDFQLAPHDRGAATIALGEITIAEEDCDYGITGLYDITFSEPILRVRETSYSDDWEPAKRSRSEFDTGDFDTRFRIWIDDGALVGTMEGNKREVHFDLTPSPLTAEDFRSFEVGSELEFAPIDPAQEAAILAGRPFEQLERFLGQTEPRDMPLFGKTEESIHLVHMGEIGFKGIWMTRATKEAKLIRGATVTRRAEDLHWRSFSLTPQ